MIDPLDKQTDHLPLGNDEASPTALTTEQVMVTEPVSMTTNVVEIQAPALPDEQKLNAEFDLVRIRAPVYMLDKKAAAKRTAGAERVDKHRKKLAAEGLRPASVPVSLLNAVKAAGGWPEWQEQITAAAAPPPQIIDEVKAAGGWPQWQKQKAEATKPALAPPSSLLDEVKAAGGWEQWRAQKTAAAVPPAPLPPVEKRIEVPAKLGSRDTESLAIGRKVQALTGWKATLFKWLVG